jgi:hypothetical protein
MTYAQLKRQILNLGFETAQTYEEEPTIMVDAINRAMREITNIFPLIGKYKIAQNPLPNLLPATVCNMDVRHYDGKTPIQYTAIGAKSLYFECSGTGTLKITDDDGARVMNLSSNRAFGEYRAFVHGTVTLTFGGVYSYDIKNIAVYGEAYSDELLDISAYRQHIRYDFKALTAVNGVPVFIEFLDKVQEGDFSDGTSYRSIKDFQIEQRHILVLGGLEKAEYTVFYKKNFTPVTTSTPDAFELEIDFDKEHLLPLLAAWYVWADDEPGKAAKWRNDYEDFLSQLLSKAEVQTAQETFLNELGW